MIVIVKKKSQQNNSNFKVKTCNIDCMLTHTLKAYHPCIELKRTDVYILLPHPFQYKMQI